jgi:RNA polymerase sigma factor (sigma-70 family)
MLSPFDEPVAHGSEDAADSLPVGVQCNGAAADLSASPRVDLEPDTRSEAVLAEPLATPTPTDQRFRSYLRAVRQRPRLTAAQETALFQQLGQGDTSLRHAAQTRLVQAHLWLVPMVVRRFHRQSGFEDLVAEGNLGLFQALYKFDATRGLRFSTYAKWWVMDAVTASMAANAYPVNVPRRIAQQISRQRHSAHSQLPAAADGLALHGLGSAKVEWLCAPLAEVYDAEADRRCDEQSRPDTSLQRKQGLQGLSGALKTLSARERHIVQARFGLTGEDPRTLQDLAAELGLSAEGVRKLQLAAMQKMRQQLAHALA